MIKTNILGKYFKFGGVGFAYSVSLKNQLPGHLEKDFIFVFVNKCGYLYDGKLIHDNTLISSQLDLFLEQWIDKSVVNQIAAKVEIFQGNVKKWVYKIT